LEKLKIVVLEYSWQVTHSGLVSYVHKYATKMLVSV